MAYVIKFKRGNEANRPFSLEQGELFLALDTKTFWIGKGKDIPLEKIISTDAIAPVFSVAGKIGDVEITSDDILVDNLKTFVSEAQIANWNSKQSPSTTLSGYGITDAAPLSHVGNTGNSHGSVTTTTNGFMSSADKTKLDGISENANEYIHPESHTASIIVQDANNRFVTDAEKTTWNAKQVAIGYTPENVANKDVINGYAGLDNSGLIKVDEIPALSPLKIIQNESHRFVTDTEKTSWNGALTTVPENIVVDSILPKNNQLSSIGSPTQRFKEIYVDEAHLSVNTLYLGDTPVVGTEQSTIVVKADLDQSIALKTTGLGQTNVFSQNGVQIATSGLNANVNIQTSGAGSEVHLTSADEVSMQAPVITLNGATTVGSNLTVSGNLTVNGTSTVVNTASLLVSDNIIEINKDQVGHGVSAGSAGLKVNRGDDPAYFIMFDENDDLFKVGMAGQLETIASRVYAIKNDGNVPSISSGLDASKPAAGTAGRLYVAIDTKKLYRDSGIIWEMIGGTVSSVAGRTGDVVLSASDIATDLNNKFVTDAQITSWNNKQQPSTTLEGYGITDATPSSHIGSNGSSHGIVTTAINGFMSSVDKTKLDGIAENANKYLHPNHTGDVTSLGDGAVTLINSGVTAGTYKSVTVDAKGRVTNGTNPTTLSGYGITDAAPFSHIGSNGTSHDIVTTLVNGFMSAEDKIKIDSIAVNANNYTDNDARIACVSQTINNGVTTSSPSQDVIYDALALKSPIASPTFTGTVTAPTFSGALSGNATTATSATTAAALTNARTIAASGDVVGTATGFNGSTNITIPMTLANSGVTAGIYSKVTVDTKGRVTTGTNITESDIPNLNASKITSGTLDIARLPAAAIERLVVVANQTARFALTIATIQNGDVVKQSSDGLLFFVVDDTKLNLAEGYQEFTATTASSVPWSGVTGKPTSLNGYGIIDAAPIASPTFTGTVTAPTFSGALSGNATTATSATTAATLTNTRTIATSGDVVGTATGFNGSTNITIPMTLANSGVTAGTYKSVTVDTKGRITAGTSPTTLSGYGITDSVASNTSGLRLSIGASSPASPVSGLDVWFDTTNKLIKFYSGTTWVTFGSVYM